MCDDCSTDHTVKIAEKYVIEYPNQFVLLKNDENKGLNYTLNKCLKSADGDYMRDDRNAQGRRKFKYRINEAYVKGYAIKELNLKKNNYLTCLIPILKGMVPSFIYRIMHRKSLKSS